MAKTPTVTVEIDTSKAADFLADVAAINGDVRNLHTMCARLCRAIRSGRDPSSIVDAAEGLLKRTHYQPSVMRDGLPPLTSEELEVLDSRHDEILERIRKGFGSDNT